MADEWKKLSLQPEEGRYDSGIAESVQFLNEDEVSRLQSLPEEGSPKSDGSRPHEAKSTDKICELQDLERIDSSYGSSSLTESLPPSCLPPSGPSETGSLDTEHISSLAYLSEEGDTLLHLSIIHSIPELSEYIISLAPKEVLDIQNDLYQSALHLAVYLGQVNVVEALVGKCVSLELQDRKGDTALHLACENQDLACAKILLQDPRGPQNLQLQNWKGLCCLHIATLKRNHDLISLLLESGADINSQDGTSGKTALHLAVEMLDRPLLLHLLQHRPQVDAFMYNGCTPLHLAVGRKDAGLARILCQAGADILQRNREGDTPQDLAEGNNQLLALLPFDDLMISGKPVVTSA
ncbi:NF-kappa-B inhibitor epsilon [Pseudophryne corroboree]|uniref:NF-kappa-B inhibitor epsilon n=1 Tax=Pseudophryne corroboree TaxID=495146 RepID=UPI003081EDD2